MSYIKAVSLDLDGTLICTKPAEDIISNFLKRHGIMVKSERIRNELRNVKHYNKIALEKYKDPKECYVNLNYAILSALNVHSWELAEKLFNEWFNRDNFKIYKDAIRFLTCIKSLNLKIVILSNNLSNEVVKVLRIIGVKDFVDAIATPDLSGYFKPSLGAFKYVANIVRVPPNRIIHIGDSLEEDYMGALKSGMKALLVVRKANPPSGIRYVRSLDEACDRVLAFEHVGEG